MGKDLKGKELGKGLCQRKDGKYSGRYVDRFGKRCSVYGDTIKEVKNKLASCVTDDIRKKNVVNQNTTLDNWYSMWMDVYKNPVVRLSSKRVYEDLYKRKISPVLGRHKISEITKIQVTSLLNGMAKEGYGWESLNKTKIILIDMFDRAMEDEFVVRNPARGVRIPMRKSESEIKALSIEDQEAFFECSQGTFYHNLFLVAINTGLRPGELFALTEKDIDFNTKQIHVNKTLLYQKLEGDNCKEYHIDPPKTNSSNRFVPMNDVCEKALLKQIIQHKIIQDKIVDFRGVKDEKQRRRREEFKDVLFTTRFGTPLNSETYMEAIGRIVDEINLTRDVMDYMDKFSGHAFRHTFATRCFEAGIQAKTVQTYLGHASIQMTIDLYTSVFDKKKQEDIKKLDSTMCIKSPDISQYNSGKIVRAFV